MDGLGFIGDAPLRKKIEDSIEYTYTLWEESKGKSTSALYQEETYRVIVLYIVSVIEAILLYIYEKSDLEMTSVDYKFVAQIAETYRHTQLKDAPVVIAVQVTTKKDHIMIGDLISFLPDKGLLSKKIAQKLKPINDLRNTYHLSKCRDKTYCGVTQAESALKLLVDVIEEANSKMAKR